ncbi:MAG: hypothetical protein DU429_04865 [Candidatus Tokpelaia sp.]|nr:MAG: hypothetical protein DU429_04865 [Candidatus Tokpelaia sp.]
MRLGAYRGDFTEIMVKAGITALFYAVPFAHIAGHSGLFIFWLCAATAGRLRRRIRKYSDAVISGRPDEKIK